MTTSIVSSEIGVEDARRSANERVSVRRCHLRLTGSRRQGGPTRLSRLSRRTPLGRSIWYR